MRVRLRGLEILIFRKILRTYYKWIIPYNHGDIYDELFFVVWLTDERRLALFPAGTIVRDPHHRESPTRRENRV